MKVTLSGQLRRYVEAKLAQGAYADASDVLREALRALQREERMRGAGEAALRAGLREAAAQLDRGESVEFDPAAVKRRVRTRLEKVPA